MGCDVTTTKPLRPNVSHVTSRNKGIKKRLPLRECNFVFHNMAQVIDDHGGVVIEFIGDRKWNFVLQLSLVCCSIVFIRNRGQANVWACTSVCVASYVRVLLLVLMTDGGRCVYISGRPRLFCGWVWYSEKLKNVICAIWPCFASFLQGSIGALQRL